MTTRWRDNDVYAHMNNAVFYEYVDSVVNGWILETGTLEIPHGPVVGLVVASSCTFSASLGFPDPVEAGLGVSKIGNSSVTYTVVLARSGQKGVAAEASFTHVYVDAKTHRPVPLPAAFRTALEGIAL
ncbi:MAG: thioesterase family protein [Pseudomonadota bacterium]